MNTLGKASSGTGILRRIKRLVNRDNLMNVYISTVEPFFDYCCILWDGIGNNLAEKTNSSKIVQPEKTNTNFHPNPLLFSPPPPPSPPQLSARPLRERLPNAGYCISGFEQKQGVAQTASFTRAKHVNSFRKATEHSRRSRICHFPATFAFHIES